MQRKRVEEARWRSVTMYPPTILMKTNLWYNWACIAVEHEAETLAARAALKRHWVVPGASQNILTEMHPAMVTVVAAAFALDALHADVAPLVGRNPDPRGGGGRVWGYILETFRTAYPSAATWQRDLSWLFGLRDRAVHFTGDQHIPMPHPELPTNVAQENIEFAAESATRAVNFLMTVFDTALGTASSFQAAGVWGRDRRHVVGELSGRRAAAAAVRHASQAAEGG